MTDLNHVSKKISSPHKIILKINCHEQARPNAKLSFIYTLFQLIPPIEIIFFLLFYSFASVKTAFFCTKALFRLYKQL